MGFKLLPRDVATVTVVGTAAGLLLALASELDRASWLGFVALVPCLALSRTGGSRLTTFAVAGLVPGLLAGRWIPGALQISGSELVASWLALVGLATVYSAAPMVLLAWSFGPARWSTARSVCVSALAIAAIDSLRTVVPFAGPWASIGHVKLANAGFLQLASVGGVPLVSALVVAVNASVASAVTHPRRRSTRSILCGLLSVVVVLSFLGVPLAGWFRPNDIDERGLNVLVVQPNSSVGSRWAQTAQRTNLRAIRTQSHRAAGSLDQAPDLIVWPEMVVTTPLEADQALEKDLLETARFLGAPVVAGFARAGAESSEYRNTVGWIDVEGGVSTVDKEVAIPVIESNEGYWGSRALLDWIGADRWGDRRVAALSGPGVLQGSVDLAVAICYEIQFPRLVASRTRRGAYAIVNPSSDGWMKSESLSRRLVDFARLRAIESRSWVIRSTDSGISAVIDPLGRVVASVPRGTRGEIHATIGPAWPADGQARVAIAALSLIAFGVGWMGSQRRRRTR